MPERTILVVEDDLEVRDMLQELLENKGYKVALSRSGEAALEHLANNDVALMLLDVNLPRLTGWDVLRQVRGSHPNVGVIMLTGRTDTVDRVVGLELGADDYVVKPFNPHELLARVGALLRRSRRPWMDVDVADGPPAAEGSRPPRARKDTGSGG